MPSPWAPPSTSPSASSPRPRPTGPARRASAPSRRPSSSWCATSWPRQRRSRRSASAKWPRAAAPAGRCDSASASRQPPRAWPGCRGSSGDAAGDVWMDVESMRSIAPGTEGYAALLHEIGHALGLRHPRNVDAGDAWATQLREQDDRTALSVMSQSPSGDGLFRSDWGPLDVLALRHLYGTKAAATGNTHYVLGALQGGSQTTIVDDGGDRHARRLGLSTGVSLDLTPGGLGSAGITPAGFSGRRKPGHLGHHRDRARHGLALRRRAAGQRPRQHAARWPWQRLDRRRCRHRHRRLRGASRRLRDFQSSSARSS